MLALAWASLALIADLSAGPSTGTGHMSNASFGSVVMLIENSVPGLGSSMAWARDSGTVGFGVLSPGTRDESGQQMLAGRADADTCLVDVTLDVETLAATLAHEWAHQRSRSGAMGPEVQSLPSACQELIAYLQEMLYVNARATWLFTEFGVAILPCHHFAEAREGYEHFEVDCNVPLPSWLPPAPTAPAHCK